MRELNKIWFPIPPKKICIGYFSILVLGLIIFQYNIDRVEKQSQKFIESEKDLSSLNTKTIEVIEYRATLYRGPSEKARILGYLNSGVMYDSVVYVIKKAKLRKNGFLYLPFKKRHWVHLYKQKDFSGLRGGWFHQSWLRKEKIGLLQYIKGLKQN